MRHFPVFLIFLSCGPSRHCVTRFYSSSPSLSLSLPLSFLKLLIHSLMAKKHRKLFPSLSETNQTVDCSTGICDPACPYNCYPYPDYYTISPSPPPSLPSLSAPSPSIPVTEQEYRNSPFSSDTITIITIAAAVLAILLTGFVLAAKFASSRRNGVNRQQERPDGEAREEFLGGDQVDHPIWFIRTTGLQQSVINSITICRYKRGEGLIEGTDCPVCLNEFEEHETLRLLPKCNHAFHISCIDTWLRSHTNCPLCRASIVTRAASRSSSLVDLSPQVSSPQMENSEDTGEDEDRNVGPSENRAEPERNPDETAFKGPASSSYGNSLNPNLNSDAQMESSCLFDESDQDLEGRGSNQSENRDEPDGEEQVRVSKESLNPHVDDSIPHEKTQSEDTDFPGKSLQNQTQEPRRINQSDDTTRPETETDSKTIGEEATCSNNNAPNELQCRRGFHSMDSGETDGRTSDDTAKSHSGISSNMLKLPGSSSTSRFNRNMSSVFPLQ